MAAKGEKNLPMTDEEMAAKLKQKELERQAKLTYERAKITKETQKEGTSVAPMIEE